MTINQFAIFRKDFKIIGQHTLAALGFQFFLIALMSTITRFSTDQFLPSFQNMSMDQWFPKLQIAITSLVALVAAAYWSVEERAEGNDIFLKRLPVSRPQLWCEKTVAGLSIIVFLIAIQYAINIIIYNLFGIMIWHWDDPVFSLLCTHAFLAYPVGLFLSCFIRQSIGVIVGGIVILLALLWGAAIPTLIILGLAGFVYFIYSYRYQLERVSEFDRRFWVLLVMQLREMGWFIILSIPLILATVFFAVHFDQSPVFRFSLCTAAVLFSMAIGVSTYHSSEQGNRMKL